MKWNKSKVKEKILKDTKDKRMTFRLKDFYQQDNIFWKKIISSNAKGKLLSTHFMRLI